MIVFCKVLLAIPQYPSVLSSNMFRLKQTVLIDESSNDSSIKYVAGGWKGCKAVEESHMGAPFQLVFAQLYFHLLLITAALPFHQIFQ